MILKTSGGCARHERAAHRKSSRLLGKQLGHTIQMRQTQQIGRQSNDTKITLSALHSPCPAQQHADRSGVNGFDSGHIHQQIFADQMLQTRFKQGWHGCDSQRAAHYQPFTLARDHFASALRNETLAALAFLSDKVLIRPSMPFSCISEVNVPR